ncbi:MAG: alginate export family protein [Candidatus Schekmanbacteria bacterium]|nr:alginate export family protein [Candidatus Schekmanbacteria bacterium]
MSSRVVLLTVLVALGWLPSQAFASSLLDALASGQPSLDLRLALERSDLKDNGKDAALSLTLRTRLGYRTGDFAKSNFFLQAQSVAALIDRYAPEDARYDTVADVEGVQIHQAYLETAAIPGSVLRLGRQEFTLDDHRLIGDVGWRQHAQSFDGLTFANKSVKELTLTVGYLWQVKTIANTEQDLDYLGVLHVHYSGSPYAKISGFGYFLDAPGDQPTDRDKMTLGFAAGGGATYFEYAADYALQRKLADADFDGGSMLNVFAGGRFSGFLAGAGYSNISGQDGDQRPFDTLFSTAHKFNGWSDEFLATNGGGLKLGLEDLYLRFSGGVKGFKFLAQYHLYGQESGDDDYGSEGEFQVVKKWSDRFSSILKLASYSADSSNKSGVAMLDEQVIWLRAEINI